MNKIFIFIYFLKLDPFPGKVYNHNSGNLPGVDVYAGIQIDYEGNDVTTENYLAILRGITITIIIIYIN